MRNTTKKSFALSLLAPLSPMKGKPMRKLTKEQKRDIQAVATKSDEDIDFSDAPRFSTGAAPKSASSTGQRRNPSRCAWIPTSSHGSRPMAAVIRLRRIGFYDTPCFTTPERRVGVVTISSSGVARPDIRKERLDSRLAGTMPARNVGRQFLFRWECSQGPSCPKLAFARLSLT